MSEETVRTGFSGPAMAFAFVLGAAAGAVVALLTAPASGVETRRKLGDVARTPRRLAAQVPTAVHDARVAAKEAFTAAMAEPH